MFDYKNPEGSWKLNTIQYQSDKCCQKRNIKLQIPFYDEPILSNYANASFPEQLEALQHIPFSNISSRGNRIVLICISVLIVSHEWTAWCNTFWCLMMMVSWSDVSSVQIKGQRQKSIDRFQEGQPLMIWGGQRKENNFFHHGILSNLFLDFFFLQDGLWDSWFFLEKDLHFFFIFFTPSLINNAGSQVYSMLRHFHLTNTCFYLYIL